MSTQRWLVYQYFSRLKKKKCRYVVLACKNNNSKVEWGGICTFSPSYGYVHQYQGNSPGLTCPYVLFLVNHQKMHIRRISLENTYKLFIRLQIGEYVCLSYIKVYIHTLTCTLYMYSCVLYLKMALLMVVIIYVCEVQQPLYPGSCSLASWLLLMRFIP